MKVRERLRELRERSDEDLARHLRELETERFNLRFQHATGQLDNPIRLRDLRREIARVKTIQRERELARERDAAREA